MPMPQGTISVWSLRPALYLCLWLCLCPASLWASEAQQRMRHDVAIVEQAGIHSLLLQWRPVLPDSERVVLNGKPMQRGRDYRIDPVRAVLMLQVAPPVGALLQIDYRTLALAESWNAGIPSDADTLPATPPLLGDSGPARRFERLRSLLAGNAVQTTAPGFISAATGVSLRDQLLTGLRQTEYSGHLQEQEGAARVSYQRSDALDPRFANDSREEFNTRIELKPGVSTRLVLDSALSRESLFSDTYEERERRRLQIEHTWGKSAVALQWERQRSDGGGFANALDALSLSLTHPVNSRLTAEGVLAFEDSLARGRESRGFLSLRERFADWLEGQASIQHRVSAFEGVSLEAGLNLLLQPGAGIRARGGYRMASSQRYGNYSSATADVIVPVGNRVQFLGEFTQRETESFGAIRSFGLGMSARPTATMALEAAFSESVGRDLGRERSHTIRFAMEPSAALRLNLGYDLLLGNRDGRSESAVWGVSVGGRRYVRLEGYRAIRDLRDRPLIEDALYRLEVRPFTDLAFSGSLRQVGDDAGRRAIAGLGAHLRLLRAFELEGGYRQPAMPTGTARVSGQDLRVSLGPGSAFRLFGEYRSNPEDELGALLDEVHRSLGLETRLGSFGIQGSVTSQVSSLLLAPVQRADLLASLDITRTTRLFGGVRRVTPAQAGELHSEVLRFGVAQTAGASLFLLLEGQLGYLRDAGTGRRTYNPDDSRAQARVGLRF